MSNAYGFTQTPVNPSAPNTVNASERQHRSNEIEDLKTTVAHLSKDVEDLKKTVDMLSIEVFKQR